MHGWEVLEAHPSISMLANALFGKILKNSLFWINNHQFSFALNTPEFLFTKLISKVGLLLV